MTPWTFSLGLPEIHQVSFMCRCKPMLKIDALVSSFLFFSFLFFLSFFFVFLGLAVAVTVAAGGADALGASAALGAAAAAAKACDPVSGSIGAVSGVGARPAASVGQRQGVDGASRGREWPAAAPRASYFAGSTEPFFFFLDSPALTCLAS